MERTPDGLPVLRYPVLLTSQEAATLVARAHSAGVDPEAMLRQIVCQALFGATPPIAISPYSDLTPADLSPGDGEPDPLPVEVDEDLEARLDAQHDHDLHLFEQRRHRWQQEVGGG